MLIHSSNRMYTLKLSNVLLLAVIVLIALLIIYTLRHKNYSIEKFESGLSSHIVYFLTDPNKNGRFGNNVFQYMAAEIIRSKFKLEKVQFIESYQGTATVVDDAKFIELMTTNKLLDTTKPIILNGFFQRSDLLAPYRSYINGLFTSNNCTNINAKCRVCDIVNHVSPKHAEYDPVQDLVIHFRLDDFKTHQLGGIFKSQDLIQNVISKIKYRRLFIVCDVLKQDWEKAYVKEYASLNPILINGSMLDDYVFLKNAKRLILSQSTFAWTAAFLGNSEELHIPQHPNMGPHTHFYLGCFSSNCKEYNNVGLQ